WRSRCWPARSSPTVAGRPARCWIAGSTSRPWWGRDERLREEPRAAMRRAALRAWVLCWLILVWILLWGTFSAANVISGLVIALIITLLLPLPVVPIEGRVHPLSLLRLGITVG